MFSPNQPFCLGPWRVWPSLGEIENSRGERRRLEPKVLDLLSALAEAEGQPVSRQDLLERVWPDTFVGDDTLNTTISKLRKALAIGPGPVIKTIPKRGYQLCFPVVNDRSAPSSHQTVPRTRRGAFPVQARVSLWTGLVSLLGLAIWAVFLFASDAKEKPYRWRPLTSMPGQEMTPALSPDGREVAFVTMDGSGLQWDVYTQSRDGHVARPLTRDGKPKGHPAWSPDGRRIAYQQMGPAGCEILAVPTAGGKPQRIGNCGQSNYADLAWSPDGRHLAFNSRLGPNEPYAIHLFELATGVQERVTQPRPNDWGDHDPVFAPNGRGLAFVRSVNEGVQDIYFLEFDGLATRRLTFENRLVYGLAWETDGCHLVFSSNRAAYNQLWRLALHNGEMTRLPVDSWDAVTPSLAGDAAVFVDNRTETNIWRLDLSGEGERSVPEVLIASSRWDLHPRISPDAEALAFTSNRSGYFEIWMAAADGSSLKQLTHFEGPFTGTPRWSPDGTRLAFDSRQRGAGDIYTLMINGSSRDVVPHRLTHAKADDVAPSWSCNGRGLYYASNRSGSWQVWRLAADGGEPVRVTHHGGYAAQEGPDGDYLYFSKYPHGGLWRQPLAGGAEERLPIALRASDWGNWTVGREGIYYVHRGAVGCHGEIRYLNLVTGTNRSLHQAPNLPTHDPALTLAPDESWLLFGQVDRTAGDIMLGLRQ